MKKIFPNKGKIILSRDECIRIGRHVIGWWSKDRVEGTSHFRPSPNEGRVYYSASLTNGKDVDAYNMADLREKIIAACSEGIEPEE